MHSSQCLATSPHSQNLRQLTCEAAGLSQQEGAPGHEEEESRLQQWKAVQLGELGDVAVELKIEQGSQL